MSTWRRSWRTKTRENLVQFGSTRAAQGSNLDDRRALRPSVTKASGGAQLPDLTKRLVGEIIGRGIWYD
jgi:hypothetical protein